MWGSSGFRKKKQAVGPVLLRLKKKRPARRRTLLRLRFLAEFWVPFFLAEGEIFLSIFLKVWFYAFYAFYVFDWCQQANWGETRFLVSALNFLVCGGPCGFPKFAHHSLLPKSNWELCVTLCVSLRFTEQFREVHRPTSACLSLAELGNGRMSGSDWLRSWKCLPDHNSNKSLRRATILSRLQVGYT